MPIYSRKITVPANSTTTVNVNVEGDYLTYLKIRYPPGPRGLLKVAVFYGIKQIFPYEEDTWFYGDNESHEWEGYWMLPEERTRLIVKAVNEDTKYEHSVYIIFKTEYLKETWIYKLANLLAGAIRRFLGWL